MSDIVVLNFHVPFFYSYISQADFVHGRICCVCVYEHGDADIDYVGQNASNQGNITPS